MGPFVIRTMTDQLQKLAFGVLRQVATDPDTGTDDGDVDMRAEEKEYWYNLTDLITLIFDASFVTEFFVFYGTKKGWPHYRDFHISQFTQISIPVPSKPQSGWERFLAKGWILLLVYRIVIVSFCIFVWFNALINVHGGSLWIFFSYYTIWNFTMLITYFLCTILLTILHKLGYASEPIVKYLGNFTIIIYNIELALVFLVDSVVWLILLPVAYYAGQTSQILNFTSSIVHGANCIFLLTDLVFNRMPVRLFNMTWMTAWAIAYIFWALIFYALTSTWRYPFLNLWVPFAMIKY